MKKIQIIYWRRRNILPEFEHNAEFDYSVNVQNLIIQTIIEAELAVMVRPVEDTLYVYIDEKGGKFRQM